MSAFSTGAWSYGLAAAHRPVDPERGRHWIPGGAAGARCPREPPLREEPAAGRPVAPPPAARVHDRQLPLDSLGWLRAGPHLRAGDLSAQVGRALPGRVPE